MTTFRTIMLTICAFLTGLNWSTHNWIAFTISMVCGIYWAVCLTLENKKKKQPVVDISDETKETLKNLGIKININGKEVI